MLNQHLASSISPYLVIPAGDLYSMCSYSADASHRSAGFAISVIVSAPFVKDVSYAATGYKIVRRGLEPTPNSRTATILRNSLAGSADFQSLAEFFEAYAGDAAVY